jgi:RNA polymerase sigma-70 factor (ECF subfamily)
VLIVVWRRLRSVPDDDGKALGWMIGVARRCLANHKRGTVRRHAATDRLREQLDQTSAIEPRTPTLQERCSAG